jgi:hypothetical protein
MNYCLTPEQFQCLIAEQLDAAQRHLLDAHINACPACQEQLARLLDENDGDYPGLEWQRLALERPERPGQSVADLLRRLKEQLAPVTITAGLSGSSTTGTAFRHLRVAGP